MAQRCNSSSITSPQWPQIHGEWHVSWKCWLLQTSGHEVMTSYVRSCSGEIGRFCDLSIMVQFHCFLECAFCWSWPETLKLGTIGFVSLSETRSLFSRSSSSIRGQTAEKFDGYPPPPYTFDAVKSRARARVKGNTVIASSTSQLFSWRILYRHWRQSSGIWKNGIVVIRRQELTSTNSRVLKWM